jgi:hypothetical protein
MLESAKFSQWGLVEARTAGSDCSIGLQNSGKPWESDYPRIYQPPKQENGRKHVTNEVQIDS